MKIFNFRNTKPTTENRAIDDIVIGGIRLGSVGSYNTTQSLKLSTVYRCVNLISDSVASLPLLPYTYKDNWKYINYESTLYNLLNIQPNPFQSSYVFKKMVVVNMLLKGNSYILITRNNQGAVVQLALLPSDSVSLQISDVDIKYKYNGVVYDKSQIIHIINYTVDGIVGKSTISYAADSLGIMAESKSHARNFFSGGANLAGILRPLAGVSIYPERAKLAKEAFIDSLNSQLGGKGNSIVVLDSGLEFQPISVNPRDSQLLESRQFNVVDVCRFFNVPPALAFSETGKFSTAEQQQLDYLNNTLTPILEKLESEFFRKLFLPSEYNTSELKFDVENLLRLDAVTKADYLTKMYQIGGYTTNEIREKINAGYPIKGGNRAFIQVNLQPLDNLISEQDDNKIDNKLK